MKVFFEIESTTIPFDKVDWVKVGICIHVHIKGYTFKMTNDSAGLKQVDNYQLWITYNLGKCLQ